MPARRADGLIDALALAADPDLALTALARMPQDGELIAALREDPGLRARLIAVLGASTALGDHLARHPEHWRVLPGGDDLPPPEPAQVRAELLAAVGARAGGRRAGRGPGAGPGPPPVAALRVAYRRRLLPLAARDLTGEASLDQVAAELADLAAAALEAALAIARAKLRRGSRRCRLAVIAMGKCGARELNYASDVDVIFVAEPAETGSAGRGRGRRAAHRDPARRGPDPGLLAEHPGGRRCSRWTRTCAPRAATARWCGPWPATAPTTSAGRRPGSSRRC